MVDRRSLTVLGWMIQILSIFCVGIQAWTCPPPSLIGTRIPPIVSHDCCRCRTAIICHEKSTTSLEDSRSSNNSDATITLADSPSSDSINMSAIHLFLDKLEKSLDSNYSFVTFTLYGPSKQDVKYHHHAAVGKGTIKLVTGRLVQLKTARQQTQKQQKLLMQVTLKYHEATDIVKNWDLQSVPLYVSSFLLPITDATSNNDMVVTASEWGTQALQATGTRFGIQKATLETRHGRWQLNRLITTNPRLEYKPIQTVVVSDDDDISYAHDKVKQVPVARTADVWQALGVATADGKPRPGMASKLRQCQKFVEIVLNLIGNTLKPSSINVLDMGCGRAYVTFALHAALTERFANVQSLGVDIRPKLVAEVNEIAQSLGGSFETLRFETGSIHDFVTQPLRSSSQSTSLDILIALHACDTATDDALWTGLSRGSHIIVVAPCCHRQVRGQVNRFFAASNSHHHPLADVLRHNIYRERLSETVTDSMRALLLEMAGYSVQVFEFIGGEHTQKNCMITAVRQSQHVISQGHKAKLQARLKQLASFHGVREQKLAEWMHESLVDDDAEVGREGRYMPGQMPPL